jgi:hypothetical protein
MKKEFVIKQQPGFRIRVRTWKCARPTDLNALDFVQEILDDAGNVLDTSTYNFMLSDTELRSLKDQLPV